MPPGESLEEDIIRETKYIYDKLTKTERDQKFYTYEDQVKERIAKILSFLRDEYLDVPMIERHRKFDYGPTLEEEHVW
jgi:hypothetical protein